VRIKLKHCFGADDGVAGAALIVFAINTAFLLTMVEQGGFGNHIVTLMSQTIITGLKFLWLWELSYVVATTLIKLSIALLLLRYAIVRAEKYFIYIFVILTIALSSVMFFTVMFECHPVSNFWNRAGHPQLSGSCGSASNVFTNGIAHAIQICVSDCILGIYPIWILWKVSLSFRTKVYLAVILGLGSIAIGATIARIVYITENAKQNLDFVWTHISFATWTQVEVGVCITASSVATLRPLLDKLKYYWDNCRVRLGLPHCLRTLTSKVSSSETRTSTQSG